MERQKVEVTTYDGYRSGEHPRSFFMEGERIVVTAIIGRWVEESAGERKQKRFFRVKGDNGLTYLLSSVEQTGEWYLE